MRGLRRRDARQGEAVSQERTQASTGSVKPGFGISDGPIHHFRDLGVFVALNIVKDDDELLEGAELVHGALQIQAVDCAGHDEIRAGKFFAGAGMIGGQLASFFERCTEARFSAQPHENEVDGDPVQPSGKRGFAAERANLAQDQQKNFLSEIFGFGGVANHAKAQRVDARAMPAI